MQFKLLHSQGLNNEINYVHERALWITYEEKISLFQNLLRENSPY